MSIEIDVKRLHFQFFGSFDPKVDDITGNVPGRRRELGDAASAPLYGYDVARGREYYLPVTFQYSELNNDALQILDLPYPVLSVVAKKKIIETELTERRGSVSELINQGNVRFTIRGVMVGDTNEFPEALMAKLWKLYTQNTALQMQCAVTDIMLVQPDNGGSDMVVITDVNFPEIKGVKNVRGYELQVMSDSPFSLTNVR